MIRKLKKTCLFVGGALVCSGFVYSKDSPQVVSQGGPLGAVSIGAQDISDSSTAPTSATAASSSPTNLNEKELLLKLQQQVQQLQGQLQQIKINQNSNTQFKNTSGGASQFTTYNSKVDTNNRNKIMNSTNPNLDLSKSMVGDDVSGDIMANVNDNSSIINLGQEPLGGIFNQRGGIDVGGAPAITTGGQVTFLGSYSGNNSIPIGQISSNLFASTLLGQREKFEDYSVFFGGFLEADAQAWFGSGITRSQNGPGGAGGVSKLGDPFQGNGQNIYLTAANLYFLSNLGHYVTAQFDFDTDQKGGFNLGSAFVMFGNLDTSPFFVTAGRNKLSVGSYGGGGTLTSGISAFLAPGKVTNVSLNYKNDTINTNITVFGSDDKHANFSAGLFYADSLTDNVAAGFNAGYVFNMAGAGNSTLGQALINTDSTQDNVGAFNLDANLAYTGFGGIIQVQSGWSTTTKKEKFNGDGHSVSNSAATTVGTSADALAGVWYSAINYSAVLGGRSTNFGASYGQTYNAAAIPMAIASSPINFGLSDSGIQHQFIVSAQRAYFDDNVLFGPEYVYQKLYNGEHMSTITLDMSVYF
jgi:hypothetical protein